MDPATGWCAGCARTRDEIAGWGTQTPERRASVWRALPERLDRLGVALRRPDWDEDTLRAVLLERLQSGGQWSVCACGGFADVAIDDPEAEIDGANVTALDGDSAIRIRVDRHLRAFLHPDPASGTDALLLAVLRLRLPDERAAVLEEVGPDRKALLPSDSDGVLFDLGLGFQAARFMIRTADPALQETLRGLLGAPWAHVVTDAADALEAAPPTRVAQSAGARIETTRPLPPVRGMAEGGSYASRLGAALRHLRETPAGLSLVDANGPAAIHRAQPLR
jgi:predicted Fe-S protein YdhL (DUF1289 family)